ncbi:hypothetical protein BLOT_012937 [Blomia tropicalis]|nr:hypothetical protein BLOT_012937 [Blomia tropicalis]
MNRQLFDVDDVHDDGDGRDDVRKPSMPSIVLMLHQTLIQHRSLSYSLESNLMLPFDVDDAFVVVVVVEGGAAVAVAVAAAVVSSMVIKLSNVFSMGKWDIEYLHAFSM